MLQTYSFCFCLIFGQSAQLDYDRKCQTVLLSSLINREAFPVMTFDRGCSYVQLDLVKTISHRGAYFDIIKLLNCLVLVTRDRLLVLKKSMDCF